MSVLIEDKNDTKIKRIANACHELGVIYMQHSCGNVTELFPNFIAANVDTWYGQDDAVNQ